MRFADQAPQLRERGPSDTDLGNPRSRAEPPVVGGGIQIDHGHPRSQGFVGSQAERAEHQIVAVQDRFQVPGALEHLYSVGLAGPAGPAEIGSLDHRDLLRLEQLLSQQQLEQAAAQVRRILAAEADQHPAKGEVKVGPPLRQIEKAQGGKISPMPPAVGGKGIDQIAEIGSGSTAFVQSDHRGGRKAAHLLHPGAASVHDHQVPMLLRVIVIQDSESGGIPDQRFEKPLRVGA